MISWPAGEHVGRLRQRYSRYRDARRSFRVPESGYSRLGLDWTNFFIADLQTGFGSFVAFYLAGLGWSQQTIGLALAVDNVMGVLSQAPAGALADALTRKRVLGAIGIVAIGAAALILAWAPTPIPVFVALGSHGLSASLTTAAISSMSLGLVGRGAISRRLGRNYRFSAAGNGLTAAAMGLIGRYFSASSMFLATAALSVPALIALAFVRPQEIDYARARNAGTGEAAGKFERAIDLRKNQNLLIFALVLILFQLADAGMLPAVASQLGRQSGEVLAMSTLVVIPQIVVAVAAPWVGYHSERFGRKPLLLLGFGTEVFRALLLTWFHGYSALVLAQILDGICGAIIGVLTLLVIADVTTGTGRFNLARGTLGALSSLAASLGVFGTGIVIQRVGEFSGFLSMSAAALAAVLVTLFFLPETKPAKYID